MNKIIPNIWFSTEKGNISKVNEYYKKIFEENFESGEIVSIPQTPSGTTEICECKIFEQKYVFLNTELEHHQFNDSISFIINCEDQNEIDKYWNYFTEEGEESQCGWCVDKFGLRWQILPKNLQELMCEPNANEVLMAQTKIIIAEYFK